MLKFLLTLLLSLIDIQGQGQSACVVYGPRGVGSVICPGAVRIGQIHSFMVAIDPALNGFYGIIYIGARPANSNTNCGTILIDPIIPIFGVSGSNIAQCNINIPNDPALVGTLLYVQWFVSIGSLHQSCIPGISGLSNAGIYDIRR